MEPRSQLWLCLDREALAVWTEFSFPALSILPFLVELPVPDTNLSKTKPNQALGPTPRRRQAVCG